MVFLAIQMFSRFVQVTDTWIKGFGTPMESLTDLQGIDD